MWILSYAVGLFAFQKTLEFKLMSIYINNSLVGKIDLDLSPIATI